MTVATTAPIYIFSFFSSGMYSLPTSLMHSHTNPFLEQLMGEQLMSGSDQRAPQLAITDSKVCHSHLVGNCPHDLFTNTKNELGLCPKIHNEALKTMGEAKLPVAPPLPQHELSALVSVGSGGG